MPQPLVGEHTPAPRPRTQQRRSHSRPWAGVPAEVAGSARTEVPRLTAEVLRTIHADVAEYGRLLDSDRGALARSWVVAALSAFLDLLGCDDDVQDLEPYEEIGRTELLYGRTLEALQAAYRSGARVVWRHLAATAERTGCSPEVLYRLADAISLYTDRLVASSVAGYMAEQAGRAAAAQGRRGLLAELLCRTPAVEPTEIRRAATSAQWPLPVTVAVLAVGDAEPADVVRRLSPDALGSPASQSGVVVLPNVAGREQFGQLEAELGGVRGVLGPVVPWQRTHVSAARARAAWPLHTVGALGPESLVRADDHLLALLLHTDQALVRDLVERRLAPLEALASSVRPRAEATLRAWLDAHGDVSVAAEALAVHPQTVRYRLTALRRAFGGQLDDPAGRLEIALALRASGHHERVGSGRPALLDG